MNMRESFEKEYPVPYGVFYDSVFDQYMTSHKQGIYITAADDHNKMFTCWKLSRAAIVLPKVRNYYGNSSECVEGYDCDEVEQAIGVG